MFDLATIFEMVFQAKNLIFMNLGLLVGIVFGSIPGLTVMVAIVLFLPLTFGMDAITGILMLLGIYCGGTYGGSISAILINTPGTPAAAATILDGYPLAKMGKAKKALLMALVASTIAGVISALILLVAAPQIARITMYFGPAEYFTLAIFGLSIIASVSSKNIFSGLITGSLGVFISMIGLDPVSGIMRFTFGSIRLASGVELISALIGLFAFSEALVKLTRGDEIHSANGKVQLDQHDKLTINEVKKSFGTIVRSSLIGTVIGSIPGTGGGIAAFLSYDQAKRQSKNPDNYGKGELNGVAAAEAGNNGVTGATLIPLFTLGVPGDGATAVLLGAIMMHGLIPGPRLFTENGDIIYSIMVGLIVINFFMLIQGRLLSTIFAKVSKVPEALLLPIIVVVCVAGSYALGSNMYNVYVAIVFGVIAYILLKFDISPVPLLLGIILGPLAEKNLIRALTISEGSMSIFVTRPISVFFIVLTLIGIGISVRNMRRERRREIND